LLGSFLMKRLALSDVTKSKSGSASLPSLSLMMVSWKLRSNKEYVRQEF
jgi:hypothetical protein